MKRTDKQQEKQNKTRGEKTEMIYQRASWSTETRETHILLTGLACATHGEGGAAADHSQKAEVKENVSGKKKKDDLFWKNALRG